MSQETPKTPHPEQPTSGNLPETPDKIVPPPAKATGGAYQRPTGTAAAGLVPEEVTLIDPAKEEDRLILESIQGNIVKGHGRDHVKLVFIEFAGSPEEVTRAIASFVSDHLWVQSALEQLNAVDRFNRFGIPGPLFANVLLSPSGLHHLGLDPAAIEEKPQNTFPEVVISFRDGAKSETAIRELHDPPPAAWEAPYRARIDALLILADDDLTNLIATLNETIRIFDPVSRILTIESGNAMRNSFGESIEHFGYVDGRSQPLFLAQDISKEFTAGDGEDPTLPQAARFLKFDPRAERDLVLVPDPFVKDAPSAYGSYFVYRKLEQNVRGFKQQEEIVAAKMGLIGEDRKLAGAYVVGRFEDGTPVAMRASEGLNKPVPNNFGYSDDPEGHRCPFASHIRKMNPRGDIARVFGNPGQPGLDPKELDEEERGRRIARRGITYGEQTADPTNPENIPQLPVREVGLLFMCFQASIPRQFAFLQQRWANAETFVKPGTGVDPIIGQPDPGSIDGGAEPIAVAAPVEQRFPLTWGQPGDVRYTFRGLVTMKGGEFFFAPSITFLRSLQAAG